jgi:hypothetical protein
MDDVGHGIFQVACDDLDEVLDFRRVRDQIKLAFEAYAAGCREATRAR